MKPEKHEALYTDFPVLFRMNGDRRNFSSPSFPKGWTSLVRELCAKLEALLAAQPEDKRSYARQVKSKFGGLRFYMGDTTPEIEHLISEYENRSFHTCEICGNQGTQQSLGWIYTFCDTHTKLAEEAKAKGDKAWWDLWE